MPDALAGLQVQGDDTLTKEAVARSLPAVFVACWRLDRQVHHPELLVDADLCPYPRITRVAPRILFPRLVAQLSRAWDRVEDPQSFSGSNVISSDVSLHHRLALRNATGEVCRANDDGVPGDHGRGVQADFAGDRIHDLIVVLFEIDGSV